MRRLLLILTLAAIVISGCNISVPDTRTFDWCYAFDFTTSDYGAAMSAGLWIDGKGYRTDNVGNLQFSYDQGAIVAPSVVIVTAGRDTNVEGGSISGDVNVEANANVFGVNVEFVETLPALVNNVVLSFNPEFLGSGASTFNVTVRASGIIFIKTLEVSGDGANPFPSNACPRPEAPTATPTRGLLSPQPSGTPVITETPLPTETTLPTETPFPTATPGGAPFCWTVDFTANNGGFNAYSSGGSWGSWSNGVGWSSVYIAENNLQSLAIERTTTPTDTVFTRIVFTATWSGTGPNGGFKAAFVNRLGINQQLIVTGAGGDGTHSYDANFTSGWGDYVRLNPSLGDAPGGSGGSIVITSATFRGYGDAPFGTPNCDITATPTRTPTRTPTNTRTQTTTPAVNTSTAFPRSSTPVRTATRTPFSVIVPPSATQITPSAIPPTVTINLTIPTSTATNNTGTPGTATATNETGTPNTSATAVATSNIEQTLAVLTGTPMSTGTPDATIAAVGGAGGNVVGVGTNLIDTGLSYLGQLSLLTSGMIGSWNNAIPTAIPGAPRCASDQFSSALCAIWYILDYTVLDGTIGQLLIPLSLIVIDIAILFQFIKLGRAILSRLAKLVGGSS